MVEYVVPKKLLFQTDMNVNGGRWTETNTPDWTGDDYLTLIAGEAIRSIRSFQYGVLTFNIWGTDIDNNSAGFGGTLGIDQVRQVSGNFNTEKNNLGAVNTPLVLANSTWYHIVIIWCPQFVSIAWYTHAGVLAGYAKHRNPPSRRMNIHFETYGGTTRIANVTVQGGDDALFFLDPIDHVNMQLSALGTATWTHWASNEVILNGVGDAAALQAPIREGFSSYVIKVWSRAVAVGNAVLTTGVANWVCGSVAPTWNQINLVNTNYPTINGVSCQEFGPYSINGTQQFVSWYGAYVSGTAINIQGGELRFQ